MDQTVSFSGAKPKIRILRSGTFTAADGTVVSFTDADLAGAAAAYDADGEPAPLVIGHPKTDPPAYGWVSGLSFADDELDTRKNPSL